MAKVFKIGMVLFLVIGFLTNSQGSMLTILLETPIKVFDLVKILILSACLWNGFLRVMKSAGVIEDFSFICKPILRLVYGDIIDVEDVYIYLSSNFIANLLGLGTLATISGIQAMKELHSLSNNDSKPSKEMLLLVVMNTTGLTLLPTTMMTLRHNMGSVEALGFFKYSFGIGILITVIGVIITKVMTRDE